MLVFRVLGPRAAASFAHEAGGHRWQGVPPNEKRGRVHTSTVTVAVLQEPAAHEEAFELDPRDLEETFTRGSGPGGQHRNTSDTAVVLRHRPTGIRVRIERGRTRPVNQRTARAVLRARLAAMQRDEASATQNSARREQVGSGMRGDKIRTVAEQRDRVTCHRTGRSTSLRRYLRGDFSDLR